jgi:hypothetical protein
MPRKTKMNVTKHLAEGIKLVALFGAVALVVWSMPEHNSMLSDAISYSKIVPTN